MRSTSEQLNIKEHVATLILKPLDNPLASCVDINPETPFLWSSGTYHPVYTELRNLQSLPMTRGLLVPALIAQIRALQASNIKIEGIAPVPQAAVPLGSLIADKLMLPQLTIRDEAKNHGTGKSYDGIVYPGLNYLVFEDLFSTGGSTIKAAQRVRDLGGVVTHALSIMTYDLNETKTRFMDAGITPVSLTDFSTLTNRGIQLGIFSEDRRAVIEDWKNDPMTWGERHGFPRSSTS